MATKIDPVSFRITNALRRAAAAEDATYKTMIRTGAGRGLRGVVLHRVASKEAKRIRMHHLKGLPSPYNG